MPQRGSFFIEVKAALRLAEYGSFCGGAKMAASDSDEWCAIHQKTTNSYTIEITL